MMSNTEYLVQTMKFGHGQWVTQKSTKNLKEAVAEHGLLKGRKEVGFSRELEPAYMYVRVLKVETSYEEVEV